MSTTTIGENSMPAWNAARPKAAGRIGSFFFPIAFVLTVIAFMEPVDYAWHRPTYDESDDDLRADSFARDGTMQRQVFLGTLGLLSIAALARSRNNQLRLRSALGACFIAYLAWCVVSCAWSDNPSMSLRRIAALACEVLAGVAIATRSSPRQFAWFVFACTLTWFGLGLLAEIAHGALQPWQAGYRFKGIFHPNVMSAACAVLVMASLYLSRGAQHGRRILQAVAVVAFVFLLLTGSRTAVGALLITLAVVWTLASASKWKYVVVGVSGLAIGSLGVAGLLGALSADASWVAMGRQDNEVDSLSSRLPLWEELIGNYATRQPIGGYGYGAFWSPPRIFDVARTQGWNPAYAHSTYVDLLVNIGIVGIVLFLVTMLLAFFTAVRLEMRHANAGFGFAAMLIAFLLLDGALETTFGSTWFMSFFAICTVCLLLASLEDRQRRTISGNVVRRN